MGEAGKSACASTLMSRACAQNAFWRSQWIGLKNLREPFGHGLRPKAQDNKQAPVQIKN